MLFSFKWSKSNIQKLVFPLVVLMGIVAYFSIKNGLLDKKNREEPEIREPVKNLVPRKRAENDILVKIENRIRRGDTIIKLLTREGLPYQAAYKFFQEIKPTYNLKKISAGKKYTLYISLKDQTLKRFKYEIDENEYLEVTKDNHQDSYRGQLIAIPYKTKEDIIHGEIEFSLFESILKCGEKAELADIMASLFEYDIDFNRDIREKDSFSVIVQKKYLKGKFVRYGHVIAAEFSNRGKVFQVVRYTDAEGKTAYYHPDGRSVRKMFLRCPLPFMRVTSRYGNRRHPVLGFSARHNGVDFGAPVGTKVRTTASGTISSMGYNRGRGRYIIVRHPNRYFTHYYHLSRFNSKIRRGTRVVQGQVIGYVGNTGLTSGPHLHYGIKKNGRFKNPLSMKSPAKTPLKRRFLKDFKNYVTSCFLLISGSKFLKIPEGVQKVLLKSSATSKIQSNPKNIL
jgi:murein DD-endopeptidase MepM/ murein hydrolase activator NlpD